MVQSSATVKATGIQVRDYVAASASAQTVIAASSPLTTVFQALSAGIANTVQITGEYLFTEDNELDYSGSFTDGMSAATITFTELPADTVAILTYIELDDSGNNPVIQWKRSSGGTSIFNYMSRFADAGTNNRVRSPIWMLTKNNTIRVLLFDSDSAHVFKILGYKTGE